MKLRNIYDLERPFYLEPGDTFQVTIQEQGRMETFKEKIGHTQVVDTIVTFDVGAPMLGLKSGIGAIFGEKQ